MGKKTVRWNKIMDKQPGFFTCPKCNNCGMIQEHDWIYCKTFYYYCDCYYGKEAKKEYEVEK